MNHEDLKKELESDGEVGVLKFQEWAETRADKTFFHYGEEDSDVAISTAALRDDNSKTPAH